MSDLTQRAPVSRRRGAALRNCPVPSFTLGQVLPWLIFAGLLALVALYFVGAEEGAFALISGNAVHEWTHDGRHLLGFPCH